MRYLKDFRTNPKVRVIHNVRAVQSRKGWTMQEVLQAIAHAKDGIAYELCETCRRWKPLDCRSDH